MKNSIVLKIILGIGSAMFLLSGSFAVFNPLQYVARNGIDIAGQLTLLNDYRGSGAVLIGAGIIMFLGIIHERMRFTSIVVMSVLYSTFALGRIISIIADGLPVEGLVKATVVELIIGLVAIFALIKFKENN